MSHSYTDFNRQPTCRLTYIHCPYQLPLQLARRTFRENLYDQLAHFTKDTTDGREKGVEHFEHPVAREYTRRAGGGYNQSVALQIPISVRDG